MAGASERTCVRQRAPPDLHSQRFNFPNDLLDVRSWSRGSKLFNSQDSFMPHVLIRHKIANYAKWKRAVHAAKAFRKASGEKSFRCYRSSASPNLVTVVCNWSTAAKMKKFIKSAELRKAMRGAGVVSKPEVQFFSKAEDLSV